MKLLFMNIKHINNSEKKLISVFYYIQQVDYKAYLILIDTSSAGIRFMSAKTA